AEQLLQALAACARLGRVYAWMGDALDRAACSLLCLGRGAEALQYCEQGVTLSPEHAGLWVTRGQLQLNNRDYEAALASFQQARSLEGVAAARGLTSLRESTWVPLFGMGVPYARLGKAELARRCLLQAQAMNPNH